MRSCLSLLVMLAVIAIILAAGYAIYQKQAATTSDTTLTLKNTTSYGLTVDMKGPLVVQFAIMPGKSQTRTIAPGKYDVHGSISDPNTDKFQTSWSFERGGKYNADFTRSGGGGGGQVQLILASQLQQQQPQ